MSRYLRIAIAGLAAVLLTSLLPSLLWAGQKKAPMDCRKLSEQECSVAYIADELFGQTDRGPYVPQALPHLSTLTLKPPQESPSVIVPVLFELGKADILPEYATQIDKVGNALKERPDKYLWIYGHTDSIGSDSANLILSEKRALSVRRYILDNFPTVSAERLIVQGYGERRPIATNKTDEGRQQNRRIEFVNRVK
jgi:outer membrane protein OmpA-like peptidoglycan-associated protein